MTSKATATACIALVSYCVAASGDEVRVNLMGQSARDASNLTDGIVVGHFNSQQSDAIYGDALSALCADVFAAATCASVDGWDGPGTFATNSDVVDRALKIVPLIAHLPGCEVSVTPAGSISFDWEGTDARFAIMIPVKKHGIAFASLIGDDRNHGAMHFDGEKLPEEIALAIRRWQNA